MASTSSVAVILGLSILALTTACETKIRITPCTQNSAGECQVDFGKVYVGRSADETVTVENITDEAIEVSPAMLGSKEFTLNPELGEVLAIDENDDAEFEIVFVPEETKSYAARIFFQGLPAPESTTILKLVGEGIGLEAKGDLQVKSGDETVGDDVGERISFRDRIAPVQLHEAERKRVRITNTHSRRIRLTVEFTNRGPGNINGFYILGIDSSGNQIGRDPTPHSPPIKFPLSLDGSDWIEFVIAFIPPKGKPDPYTGFIKVYEGDDEDQHFAHVGFSGRADDPPENEGHGEGDEHEGQ